MVNPLSYEQLFTKKKEYVSPIFNQFQTVSTNKDVRNEVVFGFYVKCAEIELIPFSTKGCYDCHQFEIIIFVFSVNKKTKTPRALYYITNEDKISASVDGF